jgi:hypothetical protein
MRRRRDEEEERREVGMESILKSLSYGVVSSQNMLVKALCDPSDNGWPATSSRREPELDP